MRISLSGMQEREISPEGTKFLPGTRLAKSLVKIPTPRVRLPILHGLAHDGLFFSHF